MKLDDKGRKLRAKMGEGFVESLKVAIETLSPIDEPGWNADAILEQLKARAEAAEMKLGDLLQPIRVALTGSTVSEPVNELLVVVGRSSSLARLSRAADRSW